jgi:hypothetical protein
MFSLSSPISGRYLLPEKKVTIQPLIRLPGPYWPGTDRRTKALRLQNYSFNTHINNVYSKAVQYETILAENKGDLG